MNRFGPSFPIEITKVNAHISVLKNKDTVNYYNDNNLIYIHKASDKVAFRFISCQLYLTGLAKQTEIKNAFKIGRSTLIVWINNYRKFGAKSFYDMPKKELKARIKHKKRSQKKESKLKNIIEKTSSKNNVMKNIFL